jgi:hypothetical protein
MRQVKKKAMPLSAILALTQEMLTVHCRRPAVKKSRAKMTQARRAQEWLDDWNRGDK